MRRVVLLNKSGAYEVSEGIPLKYLHTEQGLLGETSSSFHRRLMTCISYRHTEQVLLLGT